LCGPLILFGDLDQFTDFTPSNRIMKLTTERTSQYLLLLCGKQIRISRRSLRGIRRKGKFGSQANETLATWAVGDAAQFFWLNLELRITVRASR
jgi:hypothetical protein